MVGDVGVGIAKGAANTAVGLGELMHRIPGVSTAVDALYGQPGLSERSFPAAREAVQPTNTAQKDGYYGEQIGEFFLPVAGAAGKAGTAGRIGKDALLAGAQTGSATDAAITGGLSAVIPGAQAAVRGAHGLQSLGEKMVRSAIKPTVASLRKITGAGGMDAKANALVRFVIDNRLTTAEKARTLFQNTEHELQRVLSVKNAPTDAATRAERYLTSLERSAAKQGLGADDIAQINKSAAELIQGPMGKDVVKMMPTPHPTLVGANGQPITVMRPVTSRALRTDVMADEALESARASSRWGTRKAWGEQKGAAMEAAKAVEKAQRDAVKAAVPEARALLATEGKAIQAEQALDRMAQRSMNRDPISMPAQFVGAGEVLAGQVPVLAFASNWLRNNGMKAGIWADALGKAIENGNAPLALDILKRLGVGSEVQMAAQGATP